MTISCWNVGDVRVKSSLNSPPNGPLSITSRLSWAAGYVAAISKVLDDAGIPNFIWGDFLNALWDSPFVIIACGFIVPNNKFYNAIAALAAAGLSPCPCESLEHNSARYRTTSVSIHFTIPNSSAARVIYLCPSRWFLDLMPFTPAHPNPANLQFKDLKLNFRASDPLRTELENSYTIKVLKISSLQRLLLLLSAFQPENCHGIYLSFDFYLLIIYQTHPNCGGLNSRSLEELRALAFRETGTLEDRKRLKNNVILEWSDKLTRAAVGAR